MKKFSLLIPVAAAAMMMMGCSEYLCLAPPGTTAKSKLTICHATGKAGKFQLLTIKASAADAHIRHGDFLAPAGAKKAKDCVEESGTDTVVVVPPVVVDPVDTVVVPPVVVDPTDTVPPFVEPEPPVTPPVDTVVVVPPVVVPPVVVPPTDTTVVDPTDPDDGGTSEEGDHDGGSVIDLPGDIDVPLPCVVNPNLIECLL